MLARYGVSGETFEFNFFANCRGNHVQLDLHRNWITAEKLVLSEAHKEMFDVWIKLFLQILS